MCIRDRVSSDNKEPFDGCEAPQYNARIRPFTVFFNNKHGARPDDLRHDIKGKRGESLGGEQHYNVWTVPRVIDNSAEKAPFVRQTHALLVPVSYTHLRAHETRHDLVCRLLLEKK